MNIRKEIIGTGGKLLEFFFIMLILSMGCRTVRECAKIMPPIQDKKEKSALARFEYLKYEKPVYTDKQKNPVELRIITLNPTYYTVKNIPDIIKRCKTAGFNMVMLTVYNSKGAAFNNTYNVPLLKSGVHDFTCKFIKEARKNEFLVGACFGITMAQISTPKFILAKNRNMEPDYIYTTKGNKRGAWGSVFNYRWRRRMNNIVKEFLTNFKVNAVMWAFVRIRPDFSMYNESAYKNYYGRNYKKDMNIKNKSDIPWQIIDWHQLNLNTFLCELKDTVKKIDPTIQVVIYSDSPLTNMQNFTLNTVTGVNILKVLNFNLTDKICISYQTLRKLEYCNKVYEHIIINNCSDKIIGSIANWRMRTSEEMEREKPPITSVKPLIVAEQIGAMRKFLNLKQFLFQSYSALSEGQIDILHTTVFEKKACWRKK